MNGRLALMLPDAPSPLNGSRSPRTDYSMLSLASAHSSSVTGSIEISTTLMCAGELGSWMLPNAVISWSASASFDAANRNRLVTERDPPPTQVMRQTYRCMG
jgi:hypothetical protein